ncbi:MAG: efflux RND transporter periplasmic adaptor subunit [bacterium]|nr:efflux RND transporter periplasmic adaptor subunit [bacterium]
MRTKISLIKKHPVLSSIVGIGIIVGGFFLFRGGEEVLADFAFVERKNISEEVSVTGNVQPARAVDLAFERTGRVSRISVDVGSEVGVGASLIVLENSDIAAQLKDAEARVKIEQAALDELLRGARLEEIRSQEIKVENAKTTLDDARKNLVDVILDAFTKGDDAIRNKLDQIFVNPQGGNYTIYFTVNNPQLENDIKNGRAVLEGVLDTWQISLLAISADGDLFSFYTEAKNNIARIRSELDISALAVNQTQASPAISQTTLDGYKTDIATARTAVNTASANISSAQEKLQTAESTLSYESQQLVVKTAGPTGEAVRVQEAKLEQAEAAVANKQADLAKTILRSPMGGIVTKQDTKVGQIVSAGVDIVSLISESEFEVKVNIPETDITKITLGNNARITLDAYTDEDMFPAHVVTINPAENVIDGVVTYQITLQFDVRDPRIKSGMTANVDIVTAVREHVLTIPARSVFSKNGNRFVRVVRNDGSIEEREVSVGLRGSFAEIEIISGLTEGEKVATFFRE